MAETFQEDEQKRFWEIKARIYCQILGIQSGSPKEEIKSAFRKKAFECHPDHNRNDKNAKRKFRLLFEAYSFLMDPENSSLKDLSRLQIECSLRPELKRAAMRFDELVQEALRDIWSPFSFAKRIKTLDNISTSNFPVSQKIEELMKAFLEVQLECFTEWLKKEPLNLGYFRKNVAEVILIAGRYVDILDFAKKINLMSNRNIIDIKLAIPQ